MIANGLQLAGLIINCLGAVLLVLPHQTVKQDIQWVGGKPVATLTRLRVWWWGFLLLLVGFAMQAFGLLWGVWPR